MTQVIHVRDMRPGDVYIGRGFRGRPASVWANPWKVTREEDRAMAIRSYKTMVEGRLSDSRNGAYWRAELEKLRGKRLACWCHPKPCHGDVLVELLAATEGGR